MGIAAYPMEEVAQAVVSGKHARGAVLAVRIDHEGYYTTPKVIQEAFGVDVDEEVGKAEGFLEGFLVIRLGNTEKDIRAGQASIRKATRNGGHVTGEFFLHGKPVCKA